MKLEKPINENYCATVVALKDFVDLPNCDNVKSALLFGNSVIVAKYLQPGMIGLFFPVECQLGEAFLSANNLYRKAEFGNVDPAKVGFFEKHGRVKCMKFRGHKSEGFWIPMSSLEALRPEHINPAFGLAEGDIFDHIDGIEICRKFIPTSAGAGGPNQSKTDNGLKNKIVEGQFKFHYDTSNLRKNIHNIHPNDIISISDKFHGTSAVFSNLLVKRELNWIEKLLKRFKISIQETEYNFAYSSRKCIKKVGGNNKKAFHENIWSIVAGEIEDRIPKSYSVYGEIVGYNANGAGIQSGTGGKVYDYGCIEEAHKFVIYRVTNTNIDGKTLELNWSQMKEFCIKYGLEMVRELFYGRADDLVPFEGFQNEDEWRTSFLAYIEKRWVHDQNCEVCKNQLPAEGIVVRKDKLEGSEAWKLKNFAFLNQESKMLDTGIVDMETEESEEL